LVSRFAPAVLESWGGAAAGGAAKGGKGGKQEAKKEDHKKEEAPKPAKKDDDDMGLFDDDDDPEAKALLDKQKKDAEAKKKEKPKVIAKSLIIYDVKPYEAETDLDALAKEILKIEVEGLFWKTEYKKEPIAYGVFKLCIGCVVEDEKVSPDDIQERIEAFDELVQSVDIAVFSKI